MWQVVFSPAAEKQFSKLDRRTQQEIERYATTRLATSEDPRRFGKPLSSNLAGWWRYRIGDYRLICEIQDEKLVVMLIKIGHRRDIYR